MTTTKEQAQQALAEYHAEIAAGGEPHYPQWAADVLKACEEAERFTERVIARGREELSKQQQTLMRFDPTTGDERPYPSNADQYRDWHGHIAWLFNPWTGDRRDLRDVGSDVEGLLIIPPGEPVYAAKSTGSPQ